MTEIARLRIRSVKFKNGGASLTVLRPRTPDMASLLKEKCGAIISGQPGPIAGFAVVAWSADGSSMALMEVSDGSTIPSILVPDFVRNRLLAERIETWTREGLND